MQAGPPGAPVPDTEARPLLADGTRIDHYKVIRMLGRGGMGEVYLARDTLLGRRVALKVILQKAMGSDEAVERFLLEARTTARFSHPHIVTIYGVGEHEGNPYVALEYLEGQTLEVRIEGQSPGVREALRTGLDIAEALREAHENQIVHRDLKPANVIIHRDGRLRVLDFGLAKAVSDHDRGMSETGDGNGERDVFETRVGGLRGTPAYMAPEQWREEPVLPVVGPSGAELEPPAGHQCLSGR